MSQSRFEPSPNTPRVNAPTLSSSAHALVWLVWAVAAGACVQIAPNPVYVAVVLAIAWLTVEGCGVEGPLRRAFPMLLGIGAVFGLMRVALTVLTTHGVGAVWFSVPSFTLPRIVGGFTVGGDIETVVVMQALAESFAIVVMVGVFGAFNACVSHAQLVRSAPRAFHELGLIVTIAIAFVPSTLAVLGAVREADQARTGGVAVRRGRLGRLTVPVLERGLEQAISLSESMDARGFARARSTRASALSSWCGVVCMIALTAAFVALVGRSNPLALALLATGTLALVLAVIFANRAAPNRHRSTRFTARDWGLAAAVTVAPLSLIAITTRHDDTLLWDPWRDTYPPLGVPPLLALLALLAPVAFTLATGSSRTRVAGLAEVDA